MDQTRVMLNDDEAEEVDDKIAIAIMVDHKDKFISLIHTPGLLRSSSMYTTCKLLRDICKASTVPLQCWMGSWPQSYPEKM